MYSAKLIKEIDILWQQNPEQRLGQLLLNLTRVNGATNKQRLWNATEEDILDEIDLSTEV